MPDTLTTHPAADNVIDLRRYLEDRRRQGALPLFDAAAATDAPPPAPAPAAVRLARLSASEVAHRQRMLRFLAGRQACPPSPVGGEDRRPARVARARPAR